MQPASGFHGQILETFAEIAIHSVHERKDFDATKTMFDANALFGDFFVLLFLLCGQFLLAFSWVDKLSHL